MELLLLLFVRLYLCLSVCLMFTFFLCLLCCCAAVLCLLDYAGVELKEQPVSRVAVQTPTHHLPLQRSSPSSSPSSPSQQQQAAAASS